MNRFQDTIVSANHLRANLHHNGVEREFMAQSFETASSFGKRWLMGIETTERDANYIFLELPENAIKLGAELVIGQGENAGVRAYYSSHNFGQSAWAYSGQLKITTWDAATQQLGIDFSFSTADELQVKSAALQLCLEDPLNRQCATDSATATITPPVHPSIGNLAATSFTLTEKPDKRVTLSATQVRGELIQGLYAIFDEDSFNLFFRVNSSLLDLDGTNKHHTWDEATGHLQASFSGMKFVYAGQEHRVDDGQISVSRRK
ncbi:hypothetical protein [Pseudomonas putida]